MGSDAGIVQNLGCCLGEEDCSLCCILSTLQQAWTREQQLGTKLDKKPPMFLTQTKDRN